MAEISIIECLERAAEHSSKAKDEIHGPCEDELIDAIDWIIEALRTKHGKK